MYHEKRSDFYPLADNQLRPRPRNRYTLRGWLRRPLRRFLTETAHSVAVALVSHLFLGGIR